MKFFTIILPVFLPLLALASPNAEPNALAEPDAFPEAYPEALAFPEPEAEAEAEADIDYDLSKRQDSGVPQPPPETKPSGAGAALMKHKGPVLGPIYCYTTTNRVPYRRCPKNVRQCTVKGYYFRNQRVKLDCIKRGDDHSYWVKARGGYSPARYFYRCSNRGMLVLITGNGFELTGLIGYLPWCN
ncbi:hypothetical protein BZA77DRAFT_316189 [Pyronema omphalodes]|nr:hypothetical protein BZA77DRAFT_316189 [Pyronema omphalodes]